MTTRWYIGAQEWAGISKLNEESGEVLQVIGKLMGTDGEANHWDGTDLHVRLTEELGDLLAAITFVMEQNQVKLNAEAIFDRAERKLNLFREWQAVGGRD